MLSPHFNHLFTIFLKKSVTFKSSIAIYEIQFQYYFSKNTLPPWQNYSKSVQFSDDDGDYHDCDNDENCEPYSYQDSPTISK